MKGHLGLNGREEIALIASRRGKSVEAMRIFGVRCVEMTAWEMAACLCHFLDGGEMDCITWDGDVRSGTDVWQQRNRKQPIKPYPANPPGGEG